MKKLISLMLILTLALIPLTSCGQKPQEDIGSGNSSGIQNQLGESENKGDITIGGHAGQDGSEDRGPVDYEMNNSPSLGIPEGEPSVDAMIPSEDNNIVVESPDGEPSDDEGSLVENAFIKTSDENVSTFSADVDTASYSYLRRLISQGYSLSELKATAGSSIRTEELINYFNYNYASPADGELFSTSVQIAPCPWNKESSLMILGLQAKEIEYAQKNNLVFLIDVSGSMSSQDKLGLLKKTFSHLTDNLGNDDVISIVTYSGNEAVVLEGCSGAKKDMILNAVNSLSARGSTNGEAGLKKAYELAEEYFIPGGNNRIIMASDGDLNVGISSVDELEKFVEQKRNAGVFLSVLGFGTGNYKDAKMETIADCGNGVYYYIDSEQEAEKVFGTDIFSTLYTIAKDVKLQLTFDADMIYSYRLVGYENRLLDKEDFENDRKDAGDLGAGHSVTVCYELILRDGAETSDAEWMTLAVRYKAPNGDKSTQENYSFSRKQYTEEPSADFNFISSVIEFSMLLRDSEYAKGITLSGIRENLSSIKLDDEYKEQFRDLLENLAERA